MASLSYDAELGCQTFHHRITEYQVGRDTKDHLVEPSLAKVQPRQDGPIPHPDESLHLHSWKHDSRIKNLLYVDFRLQGKQTFRLTKPGCQK